MLCCTALRGWHASRVLQDIHSGRRVTTLPRGMRHFEPSSLTTKPLQELHGDRATSDAPKLSTSSSFRAATAAPATLATGAGSTAFHHNLHELPPWPIDTIEFNALSVDGGQGARKAWEQYNRESNANETPPCGALPHYHHGGSTFPKSIPLTPNILKRLAEEEGSPAAQAALAVGGWVCTGCWSVQGADTGGEKQRSEDGDPTNVAETVVRSHSTGAMGAELEGLFPRTVCAACCTLRHDAQTWPWLAALRRAEDDPDKWICRQCGEINRNKINKNGDDVQDGKTERDQHNGTALCRCCGAAACGSELDQRARARRTAADEVAAEPIGHIVVTRNRTTRWRCSECSEVSSLQMAECRNCARERFKLTVCCPHCEAPRQLSNALVYGYGEGAKTSSESTTTATPPATDSSKSYVKPPVFSQVNCYHPGSTQLMCLQCGSSLHGGAVSSFTHGSAPWWCACGVMNSTHLYSCYRCRLPRTVANPSLLNTLLRGVVSPDASQPQYDFENCTSWFCDCCDGVNHAAYQVVAERDEETDISSFPLSSPGNGTVPPRTIKRKCCVWVDAGSVVCEHCGAPWHHQLLQNGEWWRCACHALNTRDSALCKSCGLPALDSLQAIVLSAWSRGDWWCFACGTHNFRSRLRCRCGARRPASG